MKKSMYLYIYIYIYMNILATTKHGDTTHETCEATETACTPIQMSHVTRI